MSERGDVLRLRRKLGFGAAADAERVVVIQATELNSALPTLVVVPLDVLADPYVGLDLLVRVSAEETGGEQCVAIPTHVRFVPSDRFAPGRVGRLTGKTMAELDEKLRLVLDV